MFIKIHNERNKPYIEEPQRVAFRKTSKRSLIIYFCFNYYALKSVCNKNREQMFQYLLLKAAVRQPEGGATLQQQLETFIIEYLDCTLYYNRIT